MGDPTPRRVGLWVDLDNEEYTSTLQLQERLLRLRQEGEIPDTFLLVEHLPCVTVGRAGTTAHILADKYDLAKAGIQVHVSSRGGDVTYHGPGQLVFYPIVDLKGYGRDVNAHARRLEAVMMRTAASFGVASWRINGFPGVWTMRGKLGAIGVTVRRWVTMHGGALNVCPDLQAFLLIVPCGLSGTAVTSLAQIRDQAVDLTAAREAMRAACEEVFRCHLVDTTRPEVLRARQGLLM